MSHSFIHIILSAVILDIFQYGHPLLREECGPVVHINRDILSFLDDMQETLAQGGIGLAAPQVGRPIQLVTINIPSTDATTTWLEVDGCPTTLSRIMPLNFINPILHPFGSLSTDLVSPGDHDKVIRRLRLTHPDAFEEDDDSYARRMKEKRRAQARKARMPQPPGKTA